MDENKNFDLEAIMDDFSNRLEEILNEKIENAVTCTVQDTLSEALKESFSDFEFVLTDGTIVRPIPRMKLLSPDKSKLVLCYGGLRVDGCSLIVQTRISSWESIAVYHSKEAAIEALSRVKDAMENNLQLFEL
ncbi:MAG: hypothetical protein IJO91_10545 [Oscillospiraceae bacterium]|nr:hypothetical protein [Oscillospiraceae bacterium]